MSVQIGGVDTYKNLPQKCVRFVCHEKFSVDHTKDEHKFDVKFV